MRTEVLMESCLTVVNRMNDFWFDSRGGRDGGKGPYSCEVLMDVWQSPLNISTFQVIFMKVHIKVQLG